MGISRFQTKARLADVQCAGRLYRACIRGPPVLPGLDSPPNSGSFSAESHFLSVSASACMGNSIMSILAGSTSLHEVARPREYRDDDAMPAPASKHARPKRSSRPIGRKVPTGEPTSNSTLYAVARVARVSTATVSRFFNNPDMVAPATAQRVRDAVERLGYVPNLLAGGLAGNRTRLVSAVIPSISESLFASTIQAFNDTLVATGFSVTLGLSGDRDQYVNRQVLSIIGHRPAGIILTGPTLPSEARRHLIGSGITVIETWDLPTNPIDLVVGFSHEAAGRAIAEHALNLGRRNAFVLSGSGTRALTRRQSFADAMMASGTPEPIFVTFDTPTNYRHGRIAVASHLDSGNRPDVIVCSSDWSAHGALDELRSRGVHVPDDVAVIGFGDLDFAADLQPSLSTVKIDGHIMGERAAQFMLRRIEGQAIEHPIVDIGFSLVQRASG